ncbi:MAG: hypothetical protein ACI9A2_002567 [Halioglobus sp.]|jgi:hypothetical protein
MTAQAREHLKHEVMVGGGFNMLFNGGIAYWLLSGGPAMAWTGSSSFVVDIFATAFILPFIVALIVIPMHKRKLAKGTLETMNFGADSLLQGWVNRLPKSTLGNAFCFGIIGMCLAPPLPLLAFYLGGVELIAPLYYSIFKGIWAGLMAGVLVIPMVMYALRRQ